MKGFLEDMTALRVVEIQVTMVHMNAKMVMLRIALVMVIVAHIIGLVMALLIVKIKHMDVT